MHFPKQLSFMVRQAYHEIDGTIIRAVKSIWRQDFRLQHDEYNVLRLCDLFAKNYASVVNSAVAFSGKDVDYFLGVKAAFLLDILASLPPSVFSMSGAAPRSCRAC